MITKPDVTGAFHSWNVEATVIGRAGESLDFCRLVWVQELWNNFWRGEEFFNPMKD